MLLLGGFDDLGPFGVEAALLVFGELSRVVLI